MCTPRVWPGTGKKSDLTACTAGRRPVTAFARALTGGGTLAIVGGEGGGNWTGGFFRQILRAPIVSLFTRQRPRPVTSTVRREDLQALAELIEAGTVTPVVGKTYPLIEAAEAVRYLAEGHATGKVVVTV